MLNSERCIIYTYNPISKLLVTKATRGPITNKFSISPQQGVIGYVYSSCKGVIISNPKDDLHFDPLIDNLRRSSTRNMLCVPLQIGNQCIGCIEVANKLNLDYTEHDLKLMNTISKELAIGAITQFNKESKAELIKVKNEFEGRVKQIANESLLTPLLKNLLIILGELFKCEK